MSSRLTLGGLIVMLAILTPIQAAEPETSILLVNATSVAPPELGDISKNLAADILVPVRTVAISALATNALWERVTAIGLAQRTSTDAFVIILTRLSEPQTMILIPDQQCAIVNISPLYEGATGDQVERRVHKQLMRALGFGFGLPCGTDPRGVFHHIRSVAELDALGKNFSPPTLMQFLREASRRGLRPIRPTTRRGHPPGA